MGHNQEQPRLRTFSGGLHGEVVAINQADSGFEVIVRLDDGTQLHLPASEPLDALGGTFYLPVTLAPPEMQMTQLRSRAPEGDDDAERGARVLPVASEEVHVGKRMRETGKVRVSTRAQEREQVLDISLRHDEAAIERVPINKVVDTWVPVRTEGDVTIIPVLEETAVMEKRLVLKEEVRVRLKTHEEHQTRHVPLRGEEVIIERAPAQDARSDSDRDPRGGGDRRSREQ